MSINPFYDRSAILPDKRHAAGKSRHRSIFLSDIHLGTKGCQADRLLDFLQATECEHLYLVGDIVDGWRMQSGVYWPLPHIEVLRHFLALMENGTQITYVTGNHDEFLRRYSDLEIGNLRIVDQAVHTTADGRKLLVVHGDQFDVITRYHRWVACLGDVSYTVLLTLNRYFNLLRSRFGYGYWSLSQWLKHKVKTAVNYIGDYEEAIAHRCKRDGYDGVVCGHIHHAEITDHSGIRYMNCGDWVESCTALVENAAGEVAIVDWPERARASASVVTLNPSRASG